MSAFKQIMPLLPERYASQFRMEDFTSLEEIRMGCGRPVRLRYRVGERELLPYAERSDVEEVLQRACQRSMYAYENTITQGYVTVAGGHRIGLCGTGVFCRETLQNMKEPSSVNIRIARECMGFANEAIKQLRSSALLLGPPGCGKTTLLRDLIRQLSDHRRQNIGLADERGELSATEGGKPQLHIGIRTDVLVHVPKGQAMMMLLRTMSPHWIAVDEITSPKDIEAMEEISYCGVHLLATAHGSSINDLMNRPLYQRLMDKKLFDQVILIKKDKSYTVEELFI